MAKEKHAEDLFLLNRELAQEEQSQDELYQEEKHIYHQVEQFQEDMNRLFRQEESYYSELQNQGALSSPMDFALNEIKGGIRSLTERQKELLTTAYRLERNKKQAKIEQLQKERTHLM